MKKWNEFREELNISKEDEKIIEMEKELIKEIISLRESRGFTQMELAKASLMQQSAIARIESNAHSPQINSMLKILVPLGYTLQIVPLEMNKK